MYVMKSKLFSLLALTTLAACGGKVVFEGPPGSTTSADGGGGSASTSNPSNVGGSTNTGFGGSTSDVSPVGVVSSTGFGGFTASSTGTFDAASSVSPFTAVSTGTAPPPDQCTSSPDCGNCCQQENPTGLGTLLELLVDLCGCQPNAVCFKACNGVMDATCSGGQQNPGPDCIDCLNTTAQQDSCFNQGLTKCQGDFNCSVVLQCLESCPN